MTLLDDTTLLFSDRIIEYWDAPNGSIYSSDRSAILFNTDLEGNIQDLLVDGSGNDTADYPFHFNAIAISNDNLHGEPCIFHGCYGYFFPHRPNNQITLTKTDRHLQPQWKRSYSFANKYLEVANVMTTSDGGCLIVGGALNVENWHYDWFALKVNPEGLVESEEINVVNHIIPYPNPVTGELQLSCSPDLKPTRAELYDLEGRLILTQQTDLERISMKNLAPGLYTLRVTMDDGSVYTDKIIKQ